MANIETMQAGYTHLEGSVRVFVHNAPGRGAGKHLAGYEAGLHADRSPYGFHHAEDFGFSVVMSEDSDNSFSNLLGKISRKLLGFDLAHAIGNLGRMRHAQVFWSMTEKEALALAALMKAGLLTRRPIVTSTVWMINQWQDLSVPRQRLIKWLASEFAVVTVQSEASLPLARSILPNTNVELAYFGINLETFPLTPPRESNESRRLTIFAGGNDRTRDWPTLVAAFANRDDIDIDIFCQWMPEAQAAHASNISIIHHMTIQDFVEAIRSADIAAIPMEENLFSGITFALNAAALGTPLLCSRTGGVPTYFTEDEALYVTPGDPEALRCAVIETPRKNLAEVARRAQQKFVQRDYTTRAMIEKFATCTRNLAITP